MELMKYSARDAAKFRIALGLFLLVLAFVEVMTESSSMSSGRWGWAYRLAVDAWGPYGWVIFKCVLGVVFIGWGWHSFPKDNSGKE